MIKKLLLLALIGVGAQAQAWSFPTFNNLNWKNVGIGVAATTIVITAGVWLYQKYFQKQSSATDVIETKSVDIWDNISNWGTSAAPKKNTIYFQNQDPSSNPYNKFSTFYASSPLKLEFTQGIKTIEGSWPTVEHYIQASKFASAAEGTEAGQVATQIQNATTPQDARQIALTNRLLKNIQTGQTTQAERVMYQAMQAKLEQDNEVKDLLIKTGDQIIVLDDQDDFWGNYIHGQGHNKLGKILMKLRKKLHQEASNTALN